MDRNLVLHERLIQYLKRIILIIIGSRRLTSDVFHAIMVDTENMVSSQLLKHVTDVPDNEEPINTNHFLMQRPYNSLPPGDFSSTMPASFKSWKNVQQLLNHVWRRLVKEYHLPNLTKRFKWSKQSESLSVQGLVWILKDLTLRGIWPLGRIVEASPGKDGSVRVVKVKTADETVSHVFWLISRFLLTFISERKSMQRKLPSGLLVTSFASSLDLCMGFLSPEPVVLYLYRVATRGADVLSFN